MYGGWELCPKPAVANLPDLTDHCPEGLTHPGWVSPLPEAHVVLGISLMLSTKISPAEPSLFRLGNFVCSFYCCSLITFKYTAYLNSSIQGLTDYL